MSAVCGPGFSPEHGHGSQVVGANLLDREGAVLVLADREFDEDAQMVCIRRFEESFLHRFDVPTHEAVIDRDSKPGGGPSRPGSLQS